MLETSRGCRFLVITESDFTLLDETKNWEEEAANCRTNRRPKPDQLDIITAPLQLFLDHFKPVFYKIIQIKLCKGILFR